MKNNKKEIKKNILVSGEDRKKRYLKNVKKQYGIDKTKKSPTKSKRTLKNISKNLKKSSKVHAKQSKQIENIMKKSPTLKKKKEKFVPRELPLSEKEKKILEERKKPKVPPLSEKEKKRLEYKTKPRAVTKKYKRISRKRSPLELKSRNVANATAKKTSPALAKLSASCKAAAKRKFKVYPSAYANMWAAKTQRQGKC